MPHYYDEEQKSELRPEKIMVQVRGQSLELWSGGGVFSKKKLDNGTRLLLDKAVIEPKWRVHDLGCGVGVVGIVVKLAVPSCDVVCSDVSKRAVKLTRMNMKELKLDISVTDSNGYSKVDGLFDTILFNPPYVAGRELIFRLLDEAKAHLKPGGLLQVVARHQKGGKTIKAKMKELFGNVDDSRKGSGFRVYISKFTGG